MIAEWDRATRSMWDGLQILKEIIDAGATIRLLDHAYIDLTSPIGRGFIALISVMAGDERLPIIKRTHQGRAIARENGAKMGPKFRLNEVQRAEARKRLANGEAATHLAKINSVTAAMGFAGYRWKRGGKGQAVLAVVAAMPLVIFNLWSASEYVGDQMLGRQALQTRR